MGGCRLRDLERKAGCSNSREVPVQRRCCRREVEGQVVGQESPAQAGDGIELSQGLHDFEVDFSSDNGSCYTALDSPRRPEKYSLRLPVPTLDPAHR